MITEIKHSVDRYICGHILPNASSMSIYVSRVNSKLWTHEMTCIHSQVNTYKLMNFTSPFVNQRVCTGYQSIELIAQSKPNRSKAELMPWAARISKVVT